MKIERAYEILNNNEICNVYYNNNPIWIQEINNGIAKVGFMYGNIEQKIEISKLYE